MTDAPNGPWFTSLPPCETLVPCGRGRHFVRWEAGELRLPSHCSATSATRPARAAVSTDRMVRPSSPGSSSRSACAATTWPASRIWNPVPSASSDSMSSLRWLASPASYRCWWCLMAAAAIAARGGLASGPAP